MCWDNKVAQFAMGSALSMRNNDFNDRAFVFYHERMQLESTLTLFDATAVTPVEMALCLRELIVRPLTEIPSAFLVDEESKMGPAFPFVLGENEEPKDLAALLFDGGKKLYVAPMPVALVLRDLRECMDYYLALAIKEVRADLFPEDLVRALACTMGFPLEQKVHAAVHEAHVNIACVGKEYENEELQGSAIRNHGDAQLADDSIDEDDEPEIMEDFDGLQLTEEEIGRITLAFGELVVFDRSAGARLLGAFEGGDQLQQIEPELTKPSEATAVGPEEEEKDDGSHADADFDEDDEDNDIILLKAGELMVDDDY